MEKEDLRVIRTRKLLSNTLLDMMEETSIEKISVIDLCTRAMVNRATFYAHFEDKYHLLTYALEELKDNLYANFMRVEQMTTPEETVQAVMRMAIDFFYDKRNHIANILYYNSGGKVISTIQDSIAHSIKYQLGKFRDAYEFRIPITLIANFLAGGMMNTALYCIANPGKHTYEEFVNYSKLYISSDYFVKKPVTV